MKRVFEDDFMDIQTGLVSLCQELTGDMTVGKVFAYGSLEKNCAAFNAFYELDGRIVTASGLCGDRNTVGEFLRLGTGDLISLRDLCEKNGRPVPTEIRLIYDCGKKTLDTKYQYRSVCAEETGMSPAKVFLSWKCEVEEGLKRAEAAKKNTPEAEEA